MEQLIEASSLPDQAAFEIDGWSVEPATLRMQRAGKTARLEPKVMAVLVYLASRRGRVVSRQELEENIWAGTVVGYDAISNAIIKLRKAFGDDAQNPAIIETIPRTGYRLISEVESPADEPGSVFETASGPGPANGVSQLRVNARQAPAITTGRLAFTIGAPLMLLIAVVLLWFEPWAPALEPASEARMALPLPDKPSIAVLPFTNMSADPGQEYFTDGMTEDLITDLSKISGLFVVARNSVFTYKGKPVKIREVAEDLGVRYVLEGSVRRVDDQVRINAQLIDALSGGHVWAQRYDGVLGDVFRLQDAVTRNIVKQLAASMSVEAATGQVRTDTPSTLAYDLFLRGWDLYRAGGAGDYAQAIGYFERALAVDPDFNRARAALAAVHWNILEKRLWQDMGIHYYKAFEQARKSLRRSQQSPTVLTHQIASEWAVFYSKSSARRALVEARMAIELDPNDPAGHLAMGYALLKDKKPRAAEQSLRTAMRLDPHFPPQYLLRLAQAQFQSADYRAAVESLTGAIARSPENDWAYVYLAAAYGQLDEADKAKAALQLANELRAAAGWGPVTIVTTSHPLFRWQGDRDALKRGLRIAGAPSGGEWYRLVSYMEPGSIAQTSKVEGVTIIDAAEAKQLHDRGVLFVDTQYTWLNERIPGSHFLEWWSTEGWIFNEVSLGQLASKDQEIVIYAFGRQSKFSTLAAALAVSRGFNNIYYFAGGLDAWKAAGFPTETPE